MWIHEKSAPNDEVNCSTISAILMGTIQMTKTKKMCADLFFFTNAHLIDDASVYQIFENPFIITSLLPYYLNPCIANSFHSYATLLCSFRTKCEQVQKECLMCVRMYVNTEHIPQCSLANLNDIIHSIHACLLDPSISNSEMNKKH